MHMNTPVEAQSISSLANLLANPPRYPRNPTHQVHNALVLYIVRVPGSRDVFLTTLKPPTKASISIEAVQSSLYFLHVERPEDDELRQSLEAASVAENYKENVSPIQRKPLPTTPFANYPPSQKPPTPPKSYPHYQPPLPGSEMANQAQRYAARGINLRLNTADPSKPFLASRRPVGARLMPNKPDLQTDHSPERGSSTSTNPVGHTQRRISLGRKPVGSMLPYPAHEPATAPKDQPSPQHANMDPALQETMSRLDGSTVSGHGSGSLRIILIRRDPASGSQWNVGSILPHGASTNEVDITLTSPGYTPFAGQDTIGGEGFRRKVAFTSNDAQGGWQTTKRSNSEDTVLSHNHASSSRSRQTYGFLSPWQGMCSFNNGIDGKSLRCRQFLPGANPSMPGMAADVAELRFNLPWAALRLKDPSKKDGNELSEISPNKQMPLGQGGSNREQWRRSLQVLTHKARKQLSSIDNGIDWRHEENRTPRGDQTGEQHRMSLHLGREKAGGGFKGHSAKLGKLIIYDEGLKMCDLVVASCMGVWWQHYSGET